MTKNLHTRTILMFALLAGAAGCKHEPPPPAAAAPVSTGTETTVVHQQPDAGVLEIPAKVAADPTKVVHIYPPLSGRILDLKVLPGQEVQRGQTLAMLQSGDVAQARSDFEKAKIEVLRADRALERGKLLLQHEVLSQADYYELEATDQADHAELERTRQRIRELGFSETDTSDMAAIQSPITGTVLDLGTSTGELQRSLDNAAPIATIANLDTVWAVGDVFERDLTALKQAESVQVAVPAYPGTVLTGRIANISDAIDPVTHTLKVRVVLPNPGHRLKPEMFASLRVQGQSHASFLVPAAAVLYEGDKTTVFVQTSPGKYEQRNVTLGTTQGKTVEITAGLKDGDTVVTAGAAMLRAPEGD